MKNPFKREKPVEPPRDLEHAARMATADTTEEDRDTWLDVWPFKWFVGGLDK